MVIVLAGGSPVEGVDIFSIHLEIWHQKFETLWDSESVVLTSLSAYKRKKPKLVVKDYKLTARLLNIYNNYVVYVVNNAYL